MAGFDVSAARQAGYSDDEILQHLTATRPFDVAGAIKSGYSKPEIIDHLSSAPAQPRIQPPALRGTEGPGSSTMQESLVPKVARAATAALPAIGGMGGAAATAPGVLTTAAGAGLGTAAGTQAKLLLNRGLFGKEETSPSSPEGLKETAIQGAIAGGTTAALGAATNLLTRAPQASNPSQTYREINDAIDAKPSDIRMGERSQLLEDATTMPGRALAKAGLTPEQLKAMTPPEQSQAIAPLKQAAGKAIGDTLEQATQSGVKLDAGQAAYAAIKKMAPAAQDKAIDAFHDLVDGLGIQDVRNVTPTEAWQLRNALKSGANFSPNASYGSLGEVRADLYRSVGQDLKTAVPDMVGLDQNYSDLSSAMKAVLRANARYATNVPVPPASALSALGKELGKQALKGAGIGAAGYLGYHAARELLEK